jgi:uncharacterized membrane protein YdbT with pleckstrin-like domain
MAEDERILLSTRRHGFVLFEKIFFDLVILLVLIIGTTISLSFVGPVGLIGYAIGIIPLIDMFRHVFDWRSRQFVITNRRVIQISGIINKDVTDSSLEKVNDVKLSQSFWGRLFGYGDVEILTASELGTNQFQFIGEPVTFKKIMMDAKNRLSGDSGEGMQFKNVIKEQTIPDLIAELDELRIKGIVTQEEFQTKKKELLSRM